MKGRYVYLIDKMRNEGDDGKESEAKKVRGRGRSWGIGGQDVNRKGRKGSKGD